MARAPGSLRSAARRAAATALPGDLRLELPQELRRALGPREHVDRFPLHPFRRPLLRVLRHDDLRPLRRLLEVGADPNAVTRALLPAAGDAELAGELLVAGQDRPLALLGHADVERRLVQRLVDPVEQLLGWNVKLGLGAF